MEQSNDRPGISGRPFCLRFNKDWYLPGRKEPVTLQEYITQLECNIQELGDQTGLYASLRRAALQNQIDHLKKMTHDPV